MTKENDVDNGRGDDGDDYERNHKDNDDDDEVSVVINRMMEM
jgi:hypothetical protein